MYSELWRVCIEEEVRARLRLGARQLSSRDLGERKVNLTDKDSHGGTLPHLLKTYSLGPNRNDTLE